MTENEAEHTILRARNLSQELMLREENEIAYPDRELIAEALNHYAKALYFKVVSEHLDDMERTIVAGYVGDLAQAMRNGVAIMGPTDSELCARVLRFYISGLEFALDPADAEAA